MDYKEKIWRNAFELDNYHEIDGNLLLVIIAAKEEFDKLSQGKWNLVNYVIWLRVSMDNEFALISFIPKVEQMVEDIFFEIPYKGEYYNGRGYQFYYNLKNIELLEVVGMR